MRKNDAINLAVQNLKSANIILCPTDSIYGISCDATNPEAVQKVIDLKNRKADKSFIVLVNSDRMMNQCFKEIPAVVWDLVDYSNSPLTIVMQNGRFVAPNVLNKDGSLGVRYVKSGAIFDILHKFNRPIISTSANLSGEKSPQHFDEISDQVKSAVDFIFPEDSADKMSGEPSKVIRIDNNSEVEILRK